MNTPAPEPIPVPHAFTPPMVAAHRRAGLLLALALALPCAPAGAAATFEQRADALLQALAGAPLPAPGGTGKLPYGVAVARLRLDPDDAAARGYIALAGHGGEAPFNALYQIRGYIANRERFSAAEAEQVRLAGMAVPEWNQDYTENHRVLLWSSALLYAQEFPSGQWIWSGVPVGSAQLGQLAGEALAAYGRSVYDRGYSDFLSPVYDLYKVAAWLNLHDLATQPQVRDMAAAMLHYHFATLALGSFEEQILAPLSRAPANPLGRTLGADSQWLLWQFFGWGDAQAGMASSGSIPVFILALTGWRPHPTVGALACRTDVLPAHTFRTRQPSFFMADPLYLARTTYQAPGYAVSSGVFQLRPDEWERHGYRQTVNDDAFAIVWDSPHALRSIAVMHPYWSSAAGENSWACRSSPFMQAGQHRDTAIVLFDIPAQDPFAGIHPWGDNRGAELNPLAQLRYPAAGAAYASYGDDWIGLDAGEVLIGIRVLKPGWARDRRAIEAEGFHVIKSRGPAGGPWRTGFVIEVAPKGAHPGIAAFMAALKANQLAVSEEPFGVLYTTSRGERLHMVHNSSLERPQAGVPWFSVNGTPVDYAAWPHLASPWTTLDNGILQIEPLDPFDPATPALRISWPGGWPAFAAAATAWQEWCLGYFGGVSEAPATVVKGGHPVPLADAYVMGGDPGDPHDYPRLSAHAAGPGLIGLRFNTRPGRLYQPEWSPALEPGRWIPASLPIEGSGDELEIPVDLDGGGPCFFRMRVELP